MKKGVLSLLLLLSTVGNANLSNPIIVEFRPNYFLPSSETLNDIYHTGGIDYQLTGTIPLYQGPTFWARCFSAWWAVDYFDKTGKSEELGTLSHITMVPITLGLKYTRVKGRLRPYLGLGMRYWFVNISNQTTSMMSKTNKNGIGGVGETGLLFFVHKYWTLDLFSSYSYKKFGPPTVTEPNIETTTLQVGGWNFGGGIGFKW